MKKIGKHTISPAWIDNLKPCKKVTRQDIKGMPETINALESHLDFLKNFKRFREEKIPQPPHLLFHGAPGNGKTFVGCWLATESEAKFASASEAPYQKWNADSIKSIFGDCRDWVIKNSKPLILFCDEFDAIAKKKDRNNITIAEAAMVSQLLCEIDGVTEQSYGLLIIGATNKINELEPSIYRPGRLGQIIPFPEPDKDGLQKILTELAADAGLPVKLDYSTIAEILISQPISAAAQVIERTNYLRKTLKGGKKLIEQFLFQVAVEQVIGFKTNIIPPREEKFRVIVHEIGHGLVHTLLGHPAQVLALNPRQNKDQKGKWSTIIALTTSGILSKKDLEIRLATLYGGLVAEKICGLSKEAGARGDLEKAGGLAAWWADSVMKKEVAGRVNLAGLTNFHYEGWGSFPQLPEAVRKESIRLSKRLLDRAERTAYAKLKKVGKKKILALAKRFLKENHDIVPRKIFLKNCRELKILPD